MSEYAGKIRATIASVFPDLLRAYTDTPADGDAALPRHQPTTIMAGLLRLMDALLSQVCVRARARVRDGCAAAAIACKAGHRLLTAPTLH